MNNKKMIVMDLDGTLLNKESNVTEILKEYLKWRRKKDGTRK